MRSKIETFFKDIKREGKCGITDNSLIYIIDRKEEQQGSIEILDKEDYTIKGLRLHNDPQLDVYYYAFEENSFKHERYDTKGVLTAFAKGERYRQCECILFPSEERASDCWVLLIELKYAENYNAASKTENAYPQNMIAQIIHTTEYLRRHELIPADVTVQAILSFPNVIRDFNSTLFQGDIFIEDESEIDIRKSPTSNVMNRTQIAVKYKIVIRAQNEATIKSTQRLKFT